MVRVYLFCAFLPKLISTSAEFLVNQITEDDIEGARATLIKHCPSEFIENLSLKWWQIPQFENRKNLIQDALHAHKEGRYRLSIRALLPEIEGIITDWIYTKLPEDQVPWRPESKAKKFRDLAFDTPMATYTYRRIIEAAIDFVTNGPVMEEFKRWFDAVNTSFPNRHAVVHGKYDETLYTEENSIKIFLLLDTIYHIISPSIQKENISVQQNSETQTAG
ncbi:MAG: hypothetical protein HS126_15410 [Anaerolineales bacterium]|nr:hypothetical protein [Anaerolineales bacterium]